MPGAANPQYGGAVGISGYAGKWGIPRGTTIGYTTSQGIARSLFVFKSLDKGTTADVSDSHGNDGEWLESRARNKRVTLRVSAILKGSKGSDAQAIASDAPFPNQLFSVVSNAAAQQGDPQVNFPFAGGLYYWRQTGECGTSYTPEGEAAFSFDLVMYVDDNGNPIPIGILADT